MKLKAIRSFRMEDKQKGGMVIREKGTVFEMNPTEQPELIYWLLKDPCVTVVDTDFIPQTGRYIVIRSLAYRDENGFLKSPAVKREITLPQRLACEFLVRGCVKPVDEDGWVPEKLIGPVVKEERIKKMFDEIELKENWATKGVKR